MNRERLTEEVLRVRLSQMLINERYKENSFRIPIHLALGHEAIAVAVSEAMTDEDSLVLSHRNMHYNLAREGAGALRKVLDEFLLKPSGLARGALGSMNLSNPSKGITYTSSILGNNLTFATGLALARKAGKAPGLPIVITGDGAIEEGAFYESLLFLQSLELPAIIVVENNGMSLATKIHERRCEIDLQRLVSAFGTPYELLEGNDVAAYAQRLARTRAEALRRKGPAVVEVKLTTLGDWVLKNEQHPDGKVIHYHAGPTPSVNAEEWPAIKETPEDPVHVLYEKDDATKEKAKALYATLVEEAGR